MQDHKVQAVVIIVPKDHSLPELATSVGLQAVHLPAPLKPVAQVQEAILQDLLNQALHPEAIQHQRLPTTAEVPVVLVEAAEAAEAPVPGVVAEDQVADN